MPLRVISTATATALVLGWLVSAPALAGHGYDLDCGDFPYQQDAQAHLSAHPGDPDRLDADGDGVACESLRSRPVQPPPPPPPPAPPPQPRPVAQARPVDQSCPSSAVEEDGFTDVPPGSPFEAAVDCVWHWGVANGTSSSTYAPTAPVTRGQMAAFISRLIVRSGGALAPHPPDSFHDDAGSAFQLDINRLAAAGIVNGTAPGTYAPRSLVTRAQMAAFLVRAYDYRAGQGGRNALPGGGDYFPDDDSLGLETAINTAARAGFAAGNTDGTYRPRSAVRRDHMAAFLTRVLDLVVESGMAQVPQRPAGTPPPTPGTAAALLAALEVEAENGPGYSRDTLFGGWVDADGDGCDTRSEVLQRDSQVPVTFGNGCTVATGQWFSYFDGATWRQASDVDIDHVVPLAEAWASGIYADGWSSERRVAFANDLDYPWSLETVTDDVNQSKSDRDPAEWLPPRADAHCTYAVRWVAIKYRWTLSVDTAEHAALTDVLLGSCGSTEVPAPPRP